MADGSKDRIGVGSIPVREEFSATVWNCCQISNIRNLGSYLLVAAVPL